MKKTITLLSTLFLMSIAHSQGFAPSPINFGLPVGGWQNGVANYSYFDINCTTTTGEEIDGSQLWYLMDMNGDGKSDLLVCREKQAGAYIVFGTAGNRYWKVYLNNGAGFDTAPINWMLPVGGYLNGAGNFSYYTINPSVDGSEINGSQLWRVMDMNGDAKPDLLITREKQAGDYSVYGTGNNRYWKVFLNNGTGFNPTSINWPLPVGGYVSSTGNYSYYDTNTGGTTGLEANGSQLWYVMDMNGDAKSNLLVCREMQAGEHSVYGTGNNRYWKLYLNNGAGFDLAPINWALAVGGYISENGNFSYNTINDSSINGLEVNGCNLWRVMDMNGDGKSDLLILREKQAGAFSVYGTGNNRYWKVYLNNGTGFNLSAVNWSLPVGGYTTATGNYSYFDTDYSQTFGDGIDGSQLWHVIDMNGDGKTDLLVTRQKQTNAYTVPGTGANRFWKLYYNNGAGFDLSSVNWTLPVGGYTEASGNYSYFDTNYNQTFGDAIDGSQLWYVLDMNGDAKTDLLVTREKTSGAYSVPGSTGNRYWKLYQNTSTSLGIPEESIGDDMIIHPNPLIDFSIVDFNDVQENAMIKIFDVTGKEIVSEIFSGTSYTIIRGGMQQGIYFLQMTDSNSNVITKKLIVQ